MERNRLSRTALAGPIALGALRNRWAGLGAALLVLTLLAAACSTNAKSASPTTSTPGNSVDLSQVTLHIGDQAGAGAEALLKASGLLSKLPFKVSWADFTSGPPMLQAMAAGSIDVGDVGNAPPVFAAAGGAKIAIVGAWHENPDAIALVVPKGSSITSISQLKGKKIGVAQGSDADYHLLTVLTKAGLTVHQVDLDYLQPADGLAALSSGAIAAWDVWSPYIEAAVVKDGAKVLANGNGYGSNYSYLVASRAALSNQAESEAIGDLVKALAEAHTWANSHPQAWATVWGQATGLPADIMLEAARDATEAAVPITSSIVAQEQGLVDAFYAAGLIPSKYDFANYSYSGFNSLLPSTS